MKETAPKPPCWALKSNQRPFFEIFVELPTRQPSPSGVTGLFANGAADVRQLRVEQGDLRRGECARSSAHRAHRPAPFRLMMLESRQVRRGRRERALSAVSCASAGAVRAAAAYGQLFGNKVAVSALRRQRGQ